MGTPIALIAETADEAVALARNYRALAKKEGEVLGLAASCDPKEVSERLGLRSMTWQAFLDNKGPVTLSVKT